MRFSPDGVRLLRYQMGLSQGAMAQLIGSTQTTLFRWESGETAPSPRYMAELYKLAAQAGITIEFLIADQPTQPVGHKRHKPRDDRPPGEKPAHLIGKTIGYQGKVDQPPQATAPLLPITSKPLDAKQSQSKQQASKPVDAKQVQYKPQASKPVDAKQVQYKPQSSKPVDTKKAQSKPQASKPVDTKQAQSKPQAAKPVDAKQAQSKPQAAKPVYAKQAQSKPQAAKPVDAKQTNDNTKDTKSAEIQPAQQEMTLFDQLQERFSNQKPADNFPSTKQEPKNNIQETVRDALNKIPEEEEEEIRITVCQSNGKIAECFVEDDGFIYWIRWGCSRGQEPSEDQIEEHYDLYPELFVEVFRDQYGNIIYPDN